MKIQERTSAFRYFKRSGTREAFLNFKRIEAQTRLFLKKRKKESWVQFCNSLTKETSLSTLWSMARRYRGEQCLNRQSPDNPAWLPAFTSRVAPPFVALPPPFITQDPDSVPVDFAFLAADISFEELKLALKLSNNSAAGLDKIKFDLIRKISDSALRLLLGIINEFFNSSTIPKEWSECKVLAVPKPFKDSALPSSYRPICLLSCIRKTVEKVINNRLEWWSEHYNLLSPTQFGFRRGYGTQNCISILSSIVQQTYVKKEMCLVTFLDIKSAYDDVQIHILCNILSRLKVPSKLINFISALMSERNMHFFNNNKIIESRTCNKGLPQGSSLAPLLYNLYTSAIDSAIGNAVNLIQYADDVALYVTSNDPASLSYNLQQACVSLETWYRSLGLEISSSKSELMVFTRKYKVPEFSIKINNSPIPRTEVFRYLGVLFDAKCLFRAEVAYVYKKCEKRFNFLRSICGVWWGANPVVLIKIYKATIRSIMEFGSIAFFAMAKCHMLKLERIQ